MKLRIFWLPLVASALLALPATVEAQEDRPGMIGVVFDARGDQHPRVLEVRRGSPADSAGVRVGDVLVTMNGRSPAEATDPSGAGIRAGETVRLRLERDGTAREVVIVATERPRVAFSTLPREGQEIIVLRERLEEPLREITVRIDSLQRRVLTDSVLARVRVDSMVRILGDTPEWVLERRETTRLSLEEIRSEAERLREGRPFLLELGRRAAAGAELAPMNEGLSRYFGGTREGVLVLDVGPGTPAERAGLHPGDVIVRAGGEPVTSPEDVRRRMVGAGGSLPLEVVREGSRREVTLEWEGREYGERVQLRAFPR